MTSAQTALEAGLPDTTAPWLLRIWPPAVRPFIQLARIDRPIGWQLLLWPCWWSAALAADAEGAHLNSVHYLLFLVGAIAMRGAGSTFNDIVDRDLDRQVERTRGRPIASRRVSVRAAVGFLVLQSVVGAAVLFSFNGFSIGLGIASLAIVALYPFAKRVTHWPQAVLGLAFAWGGLMGWAAHFGSLTWPPLFLYAAAILWTMGYDTIYALQDTTDDAVIGIGSTALYFGTAVRSGVAALYALAVGCAVLACASAHVGWLAYLGVAGFGAHLAWQVVRIERHEPVRAHALFRSNRIAGLLLFVGFLADFALVR